MSQDDDSLASAADTSPPPTARESIGMRRRRQAADRVEATLGPNPLIAGIDIARTTHVVWVRTRPNAVLETFQVRHSLAGIESLAEQLERLRVANGCERIVAGMEPTAHYWKNVVAALERSSGLACVLVNALSVFHDRRAKHLRGAKGDRRDAEIIAGLVARGDFLRTKLEHDPLWIRLRILADEHEDMLDIMSSEKQRIRAALELVLPEHGDVFDDPLSVTSRAAIRRLGLPESEAPASVDQVIARLAPLAVRGRGTPRISKLKLTALLERLRDGRSFGVESHRAPTLARVARSVARFEWIEGEREEVGTQMVSLFDELPFARFLNTIPCVSPLSHALVLAYTGDPRRFDRASCLVSRAGTEPQENQSGQASGTTAISRAGKGRLREILHRVAMGLHLADPRARQLYDRLRERAGAALVHRQAMIVIANKYLRLVYRLCKDGVPFDPSRADARTGPRTARRCGRKTASPGPPSPTKGEQPHS